MANQQPLPNPPIREAIIQFLVPQLDPSVDLAFIPDSEYLRERYLEGEPIHSGKVLVGIKGGHPSKISAESEPYGVQYTSTDNRFVVSSRPNGLSVSRLAPYGKWDDLYEEAIALWNVYSKFVGVQEITRLSTRFINQISIPAENGSVDIDKYFTSGPRISRELPQALSSFLVRTDLEDPEIGGYFRIIQALEEPTGDGRISVLLDIDVFVQENIESTDFESIEAIAEKLRNRKNSVFFSLITDEAVELFK